MPVGAPTRTSAPPRVTIRDPEPSVTGGAVKRCVDDVVTVSAEIFADGHDIVRAVVRSRGPGRRRWTEAPLQRTDAHIDGDHWEGTFAIDSIGAWSWTIEAWVDRLASWRHELQRKAQATHDDLTSELAEGELLLREAAQRATRKADKDAILRAADTVADTDLSQDARVAAALDPGLAERTDACPDRSASTTLDPPIALWADAQRARFGAWYELFPRSWGGLAGTADVVPKLAELGFDVLYLTPIHPIGVTKRKGRNNSLTAEPGDPGSPWAIGGNEGGHEALHPDLGTFEDFDRLVARCAEHDIDLALDLAIQCSADHPWLTEHPEWFNHRPDGSLKYAENPPKKYQDIYNLDFQCDDWRGLWKALHEVVEGWIERGVAIFRVDNPHTKSFAFWEWLIAEVHKRHPEVIFLAEAFTRRAVMRELARIGFAQSYTYFTWMNSRHELEEYLNELAYETADYFRPNFFANTPDILHEELQHGGPPKFHARLVLAATLSPSYGIYSGYERFENVAVRPGSEEYLDSEKYEVKQRRLDGPLLPLVQRLNEARRAHPALQHLTGLHFLDTRNDQLIAYAKRHGWDTVITVVNLDPHHAQEGLVDVHAGFGAPPAFTVRDELTGGQYHWHLGGNYVRLDPGQAHVMAVVG